MAPGSCVPLATPGVLRKVPRWLLDREGALHIAPRRLAAALPWLVRFAASAAPDRVRDIAAALNALHAPVFECYAPLLKDARAEDLVRRPGQLYVFESEESFAHSQSEIDLRRSYGERQEIVGAEEIRQLEPALALALRARRVPARCRTLREPGAAGSAPCRNFPSQRRRDRGGAGYCRFGPGRRAASRS